MIGPDGEIMGTYRKSHIPDGPGYEEKFYFRPGNDGFKVWDVFGARIGVGVCWDQWYPETARCLALKGAQVLFYPTAIGSEPKDADMDTSRMWRRAMIGHAVSNCMPVVAANRIGHEGAEDARADASTATASSPTNGATMLDEFGREESGVLVGRLDLEPRAASTAPAGASSAIAARSFTAGLRKIFERSPSLPGRAGQQPARAEHRRAARGAAPGDADHGNGGIFYRGNVPDHRQPSRRPLAKNLCQCRADGKDRPRSCTDAGGAATDRARVRT